MSVEESEDIVADAEIAEWLLADCIARDLRVASCDLQDALCAERSPAILTLLLLWR